MTGITIDPSGTTIKVGVKWSIVFRVHTSNGLEYTGQRSVTTDDTSVLTLTADLTGPGYKSDDWTGWEVHATGKKEGHATITFTAGGSDYRFGFTVTAA